MASRRAVLLTPSRSSHPTQLLSRQQDAPISSLAATLTDLPASVANKRLIRFLNLLDTTLTKNRGWGSPPCASDKDVHPESANGGRVEGFFTGLTLLYSNAPRVFHNSFTTKRFRTLSQNCRGVTLQLPIRELFAGRNAERPFFSSSPFNGLHTLPSSVSRKSFARHSCENCRMYANNSQSGTRSPQCAAIRSGSSALGHAHLAVLPLASNRNRHFVTSLPSCFPQPMDFQPLAGHNFSSAPSPTVAPITEEGE